MTQSLWTRQLGIIYWRLHVTVFLYYVYLLGVRIVHWLHGVQHNTVKAALHIHTVREPSQRCYTDVVVVS